MCAKIISYDDYVKQNKNSEIENIVTGKRTTYNSNSKQQKVEEAKQTYESATKAYKSVLDAKKQVVKDEVNKMGTNAPKLQLSFSTTPSSSFVKNADGTTTIKSQYDKNQEQIKTNQQKSKELSNALKQNTEYQALSAVEQPLNNQRLLAKYNYDAAKEENHDINLYDKTVGVLTRAAKDFLNIGSYNTNDYYIDEKNNKMLLPQDYQIRQENVRNSYGDDVWGKIAKFGTDVGYNLTKIGLSSAINTLVPYAGSAMYFTDMGVDNFNQAKLDGYDDASAALYSVVGVASEMLTEKFLGGFSKLTGGESAVSSSVNKALSKVMKNDTLRSILSNAYSEGAEEFVQEFIEKLNKNLILDKKSVGEAAKNTFTTDTLSDAVYSALVGMGSGGLMGGVNVEINTNNTGVIPDVNPQGNINAEAYKNLLQYNLQNETNKSKINNINQAINYMNLNQALGNNEVQAQGMNSNIRQLAPTLNEVSNLLPGNGNEVVLPRASDNINANENINQTENITDRLQYAPTSNEKVNNLYNTASRYFNNSEQTTNLMNTLSKVVKDKGYNIVFDDANMNGINGKIETKNGETTITLNPNSPRAFEFVAVHEITHAIETSTMKNMILSYAKKNGDFNAALDSLKQAYGTNDVSSEVIADISGQLLGNQEFINNLSIEKPSLFKHLYNEIKAFYHKMRGWKSQDEFVQDLMNKWEYAYATQQNNLKNQSYSKQETPTKQNKQMLEKQFKELTGDSLLVAEAKLGNYAFQQINGKDVKAPYSAEAMQLYNDIQNSKKTSSYLYHSTPTDRIDSIVKNGLKIGSKQNQEGVSSQNKLYLSATQELAESFTPNDSVTLRISPNAKLENLDYDLLGGEGSYTITNNIDPKYLQVKENGKWVNLLKSEYAKQENTKELDNSSFSLQENNNLRDRAKSELGTTTNLNEAGYLTTDGEYLDFSGKKDGARGGQRQMDHRDVAEIYTDAEYNAAESKYPNMGSATAVLQDFIDKGNIRLNSTGIEIAIAPTQEQYNALYDYLEHVQKDNGEVFIDLDTETKNRANLEYNDKTSISKMINDIKEHYQTNTATKISTKDSNGKTLTKTQQNYFKNSKVRDDNGNLLEVYHGTNYDFTVFKNPNRTNNDYASGKMFADTNIAMFTSSNEVAQSYVDNEETPGRKPMSVYLNIKNPYVVDAQYQNNTYFYDNDNTPTSVNTLVKKIYDSGKYDGVIIKNVADIGDYYDYDLTDGKQYATDYITFNANQIKNTSNTNPTDAEDIRYSKNNKTWQQYLEDNYVSRGTRTFGKDIRKQETKNKAADHKVIQKAMEESTPKGDNVLKAQQEINNEQGNLTKAELNELNNLKTIEQFASEEELSRMEYLEKKRDGLIKYPELKQKVEFKDISKEYTKYKNNIGEFNPKLLNEAKESVKGYRNTKTKEQWLDVAENIGLHFKGNGQELTNYAIQSWFEAQPNNKASLNREGKGYVKFSIDEWVNSVYKGAGVGDTIARPTTTQTTTNIDTNVRTYNANDIDNMFQFSDNENRIIALPDEVGERLATKTTLSPIEVGRLQTIIDSATDTKVNGNQLEITSDYDNNIYTIKATKNGDAYVIDDVTKGVKNALGSVANIQTTTNDNVESIDTKKSKIENGETIGEVINRMKTQMPKQNDIKAEYKETVEQATNKGESKFYKNATETSQFITEENRAKLSEVGDLKYYDKVTNEESLAKASKRLSDYGTAEAYRWMQQDNKTSSATDVAEGWILLKNYQDAGDYDSMVAVAKKMREMGTVAGQTIQAYNIMARLTPEGMVKYAQSELSEAYETYAKNKSKSWVEKNASKFDLSTQEVEFIVDTMKQVQGMEDGRAKNVKLGEIQKMLTDKLPAEKGSGIKAWMRISMLFNPKTQIRNVMGNAVISPVNMIGDYFAAVADRYIAKKTGTRTTGTTDLKNYIKGFKKGLYESYDDFKRGINTRNVDANRFELGQAKSFNDNTKLGKALNRVDAMNSFLLDAGDRGFYEASFTNSINNQLALNNTTKVTQDMIDIATNEALSRTWQDNNNYTKFVLNTRAMLNKVNVKGYGLGDLLIPFAKTPANLTKAIVDYSPAGMVNAIIQAKNLKNNISTGTNTAVQQHQFVQTLGKATAGTLLYIGAYALAKAGIATGQSDDDKDTRDFMKNTLGVSSYSIKIGDKSFTYDWAQPVAAPLSIMTNIVNSKNNKGQALLEAVTSSLDSAGSILLEQSFLKSINEVLTDNDGIVSGIENAILDLPTRAVPTFMKQVTDMTDGTQRQTFEYGQPLKTAVNKIKAKIPGLSETLAPSVDSMGREIQKYGGKNNLFNVFLNPANVNTSNISEAAKEIYRVYKEVGDKTIMPRVAPYYINSKGQKTILNTEQRKDFQTVAGNIIEKNVNDLTSNKNYSNMTNQEKSDVIKDIVDYAYNKARKDVLGMEMANKYNKVNEWVEKGGAVSSYYANKEETDYSLKNPTRYSTLQNIGVDYYDYEKYQKDITAIKKKYDGKNNTNIRKQKVYEYINGLKLSANQKVVLFKMLGNYSIKNFSSQMHQYINSFNISAKEKKEIWNTLF